MYAKECGDELDITILITGELSASSVRYYAQNALGLLTACAIDALFDSDQHSVLRHLGQSAADKSHVEH